MQSRVSEEVKIREMDARELAQYVHRLNIKIEEETVTSEELDHKRLAEANYKQITGVRLTAATAARV